MKKYVIVSTILVTLVLSSYVGRSIIKENNVSKNLYKASNIIDKKDINDDLLDMSVMGTKKINIYIDNNTISFDKSNTVTDLSYSVYNKLLNSDKAKWNIVTNNLKEGYTYENNKITINDSNINTISLSFIYNNDQYNLSLVKVDDYYRLEESKVKVIHGNLNSLWYTYYNDLETAIKAAHRNDYIILYHDVEVNNTIKLAKNINIISNPGNIYTIINNDDTLFRISNKKVRVKLDNLNVKTDTLVKGKGKVKLNNTKIIKSIK